MATVNNDGLILEVSKLNENISSTEVIKIIRDYSLLVLSHLQKGDKVSLPFGTVSVKKRNVNTVMGNTIPFTYKVSVEIDKSLKEKLIEEELKKDKII